MKQLTLYICVWLCSLSLKTIAHTQTDSLLSATQIVTDHASLIPGLTKDQLNRPVLSWVEQLPENRFRMRYAISTNNGKSFEAPVIVTPSITLSPHAENAPKLVFKPSGEIIAVWGVTSTSLQQGIEKKEGSDEHSYHNGPNTIKSVPKSKYAGQVYYSQSFDDGKNWTTARPLVNDPEGNDQRYFDVALNQEGEAVIIWLDNRKKSTKEGSALFMATTYQQEGFQQQHKIAETTCQCCRTKLLIDQQNRIHVVYRTILEDSIRDMVHQVSSDGGKSFSTPKRIHDDNWIVKSCPHTGPTMTINQSGLHFAWYSASPKKATYFTSSMNNGSSFTGFTTLSEIARHPQMHTQSNQLIGVVWDEVHRMGETPATGIGMEWKDRDGKTILRLNLTNPEEMAAYPVILPLEEAFLVAYQVKTPEGQRIGWKITAPPNTKTP
ncbi:MAG: exo-alpha-sialidase [Flavipsychrobacter sp.]|nr:exo-alpha-sialidase [Flavipsychrobacter sp.]